MELEGIKVVSTVVDAMTERVKQFEQQQRSSYLVFQPWVLLLESNTNPAQTQHEPNEPSSWLVSVNRTDLFSSQVKT